MNFCYVKLYYVHIFISLFCAIKPNGDAVKKLLKLFFLQLSFNSYVYSTNPVNVLKLTI